MCIRDRQNTEQNTTQDTTAQENSDSQKVRKVYVAVGATFEPYTYCLLYTSIGDWAFLYTELSTITFPETLKSIGTYAFWHADSLTGTIDVYKRQLAGRLSSPFCMARSVHKFFTK